MVQDPVCKMIIDKEKSFFRIVYKNETYYFCSEECKNEFLKDPEKYLKKPVKPENSGC